MFLLIFFRRNAMGTVQGRDVQGVSASASVENKTSSIVHPNELLIPNNISTIQYNTRPDLQPNVLLPYSCVLFKWNQSSRATTQAFRVDDISTIHVAVFAHRGKKCDNNVWKNTIQNRSSCSNWTLASLILNGLAYPQNCPAIGNASENKEKALG